MICWRVIRTVTGKEAVVNRALGRRNLETYLPMEIRSYRPSKHTKRRVCTEVPLIPRVLFAALPSEAPSLAKHRYVTGLQTRLQIELQRDAVGAPVLVPVLVPVLIPDVQMAQFIEAHTVWLAEATRKAKGGELGGRRTKRKAKWRTASPAVLNEIMTELFGVPVEEDLTVEEPCLKRPVRYAQSVGIRLRSRELRRDEPPGNAG